MFYEIVIVLLIITTVILIVIINYINLRESIPESEEYIIKDYPSGRMWNVFDDHVFDNLQELFDEEDFEEDDTGTFLTALATNKLVRGYDTYRFYKKSPKIIPKGTLVIFPRNGDVGWSNTTFYLTDSVTKMVIYPEPNSLVVAPNDLMVSNTRSNLILAYGKNGPYRSIENGR